MLTSIEKEAYKIGLHINAKKTEIMSFNQNTPPNLKSENSDKPINNVTHFKHLGAWMLSSEKDFENRKALAWSAILKMKSIWNSKMNTSLKIRTFTVTVEPILLYGSETWTINVSLRKKIDDCYTRLLRMASNISWKEKLTNDILYRGMHKILEIIKQRRMRLAGHCVRHPEEVAHNLILWIPKQGTRTRGRQSKTFIETQKHDFECEEDELRKLMMDREIWKSLVRSGRARARLK